MGARGAPLVLLVGLATTAGCSKGGDKPAPGPAEPVTRVTADAPPPAPATRDGKCKAGDVAACDELLEHWSQRQIASAANVTAGKADAAALHAACDDKDISSACMALAMMYKYGTATGAGDRATSKKYWARVAELGDLNGFRGAEPSDAGKKALAATVADCEGGRARACNQAGWAAFGAVQQDKNVVAAQALYARGCELGSGQGCHWAGHFAYVYPDETGAGDRAESLLRKGCDLASPGACDELGLYLGKQDKSTEAGALFDRACRDGARQACYHLAVHLANHKGEPDRIAALFKQACEAGEKPACKALQDKGP